MKTSTIMFVPLLAAATLASSSRAQTTGTIEGAVLDALTRKPVADAVVVAQSPSLQGEQTVVTDATGRFTISLLPVGTYSLTVQRDAYEPFTERAALAVQPGRTVDVKLSIAPASIAGAEIVVRAARSAIDVGTVQSGGVVTGAQMQLVPYGRTQRNFDAVISSVPGVVGDKYGFAMRGSGSPEGNYLIDGLNVTDPSLGTMGTTLLQDFVQEVEVKTGGYQAEYGRSSSGIVNVVTKSGGNVVHGSVFFNWSPIELPRRTVLISGTTIGVDEKPLYSLDFGGEIGGPLVGDRVWFFAGFAPQLGSLYEDRVIEARVDSGDGQPVVDANGAPVVHEVARKRYSQTTRTLQFAGKLTWLATENHTISLAAHGNPTTTRGALGPLSGSEGAFLWEEHTGSTDAVLHYGGKFFAKTMLVESTLGYYRQLGNPTSPSVQPIAVDGASSDLLRDTPRINWTVTRNLLDPAFQDATTPDYQRNLAACAVQANGFDPCPVTGYSTGGVGFRLTQRELERLSAALKLTSFFKAGGHHQLKYGVDAAFDRLSRQFGISGAARANELGDGTFDVTRFGREDPNHPGYPLPDPAQPGHLAGERPRNLTRNRSFAFFVQDTWAVFDRVVLDVGIRGEKQLMYVDAGSLDSQGNPISAPRIELFNVMPRVGILYDLTGRGLSKVYASYGRFYELVPLDIASALTDGVSATVEYLVDPTRCSPPPGVAHAQDPRFCTVLAPGAGAPFSFYGRSPGDPVDRKLQGQYVDEFQGGVQYQAVRDVVVAVDYVHRNVGRAIEDVSPDNGQTFVVTNPGEPGKVGYQQATGTGVTVFVPQPRRVYDGISLSVRKSFSHNYLVSASYTYSALRGNYPGLFNSDSFSPNATSDFDIAALMRNRDGPLPDDVPNSFKVDAGYVFELSPKTTLQLGASVRADEGRPINYLGTDSFGNTGEVFILPRGSAGRLPWLWQIDVRAAATVRLGSAYAATFSVDALNLTDNRVATAVDENYTLDAMNPILGGSVRDLIYLRNTAGKPVVVNPSFRNATAYQLPLSVRFGARLSF
jgi:Carboxypeptidase regulatory-like domain/TonB-dependent Receptor Plug Domain